MSINRRKTRNKTLNHRKSQTPTGKIRLLGPHSFRSNFRVVTTGEKKECHYRSDFIHFNEFVLSLSVWPPPEVAFGIDEGYKAAGKQFQSVGRRSEAVNEAVAVKGIRFDRVALIF